MSKYLVRPHDHQIFIFDENKGHYKAFEKDIPDHVNGYSHFTFENLTENYDFYPITEDLIPKHQKLNKDYWEYILWRDRPDGHGGIKGGTKEEFLNYKNKQNGK